MPLDGLQGYAREDLWILTAHVYLDHNRSHQMSGLENRTKAPLGRRDEGTIRSSAKVGRVNSRREKGRDPRDNSNPRCMGESSNSEAKVQFLGGRGLKAFKNDPREKRNIQRAVVTINDHEEIFLVSFPQREKLT